MDSGCGAAAAAAAGSCDDVKEESNCSILQRSWLSKGARRGPCKIDMMT